jgi:hypothetical protein
LTEAIIVRTINDVKIEFDAVKDLVNRDKHGVSLVDAAQLDWTSLLAKRDIRRDYVRRARSATAFGIGGCTASYSSAGYAGQSESSAYARPTRVK